MLEQREYSDEVAGLADLREGPGILILNMHYQVQYMNRRSWDLLRLINQSMSGRAAGSLLPTAVMEICNQIVGLRSRSCGSWSGEWEQIEIRRIAGAIDQPVLLRGLPLPGQDAEHPRILIMMETVARRESSTHHAKKRFQLTEREHSVVERLAKGWTNKEIAAELNISEPTVKAHIRHIMDKTKCTTRTGIVAQVLHA